MNNIFTSIMLIFYVCSDHAQISPDRLNYQCDHCRKAAITQPLLQCDVVALAMVTACQQTGPDTCETTLKMDQILRRPGNGSSLPETYSVSITGLRSPLSQDEQVVWMGHMLDSGQILWHAPHPVGKEGAKDVQLICNSPVSLSLHDEELRRIVELALDPERPMSMWAADYLSQMSGEFWARRRNCISRDRIAEAIRNHSENTSWCLCVAHLGILIQEQESESYVREQFRQLEAQGLLFLCVRHIECLLILDEEAALQDFERKCTSSNTSENSVQASAYRIAIYAAGD